MIDNMNQPKCPECNSTDIKPILDPVLVKKGIDAPVIAYRCSNQHTFISGDSMKGESAD
jgi:hypothetical protein